MAASRQLPVPDLPARPAAAGEAAPSTACSRYAALGRADVALHHALRAPGGRRAQRVRRARRRPPAAHELGRDLAPHGARGGPRARAERARRAGVDRRRREVGRPGPGLHHRRQRPRAGHGRVHRRRAPSVAAWTATSTSSAPSSWRASRRWRWTCGSPTPTRCEPIWPTPSKKIVFDRFHLMKLPEQGRRHRAQAGEPRPVAPKATRAWPARSTSGSTRRRTSPTHTATASPRCGARTSRPPGRGRSRRTCGTSGTTSAGAGRSATGSSWYFWATHSA